METRQILNVLDNSPPEEAPSITKIRQDALDIISSHSPSEDDSTIPTALLDLLTQVIKPLFTRTQHPALTATGRKNLLPQQPSIGARFTTSLIDDNLKPWKTPFTFSLLDYVFQSYAALPTNLQQTTVESHFHLLVPPILNMIDDSDPNYKANGCQLLHQLCTVLISTKSNMLQKTGLADVFMDALRANFMLLPTLTPEAESLLVLTWLYPAFLSTIDARYITSLNHPTHTFPDRASKDYINRQNHLKLVLRHGVLASLNHLSAGQSFTNTISVQLTVFLVRQLPPIINSIGIESVRYLKEILPMMRAGLMDPFVLVASELVLEILSVLETIMTACGPRIAQKWWPEILRGCVTCWLNCVDEGWPKREALRDVEAGLKKVVRCLSGIVDDKEWTDTATQLMDQEEDLKPLFIN
ncbi:hypothetical protein B0A52_08636 [Exophiala mesophila]|uniref:Uncharacterized protein n=1 Tax=Exophiala mesophila TaxID=212818 RepID=A0A438MWA8_EXOME|nr:hypothetical protein B0A52_08636 [Exophiala mesophila]